MQDTLAFPFEIKEPVDEKGVFSGYLAAFNNKDLVGDIVMPGAFKASIKSNPNPPILWQHDRHQPIGIFQNLEEDKRGLKVEGHLALGVRQADEALVLLKAGALKGMSIGYMVKRDEWDRESRVRKLLEINLLEGSLVTFPANPKARVTRVKELIMEATSPRDLEKALCDAGMSRSAAKYLASRHDFGRCDAGGNLDGLLSQLKTLRQTISQAA